MSAVGLKVCGLVRPEDIHSCVTLGVGAIGINLWSGSPRGLTLEQAERMLAEAEPPRHVMRVGVFVDPDPAEVERARARLGLDLVQYHGDAPIARYAALGGEYIWVIRGTPELAQLEMPARPPAWVLIDSRVEGYGGQGVRADWSWARGAVRHLAPLPVWLAGGVGPHNAAHAIAAVGPAGLDVATGAELADAPRGHKDEAKIAALVSICQKGEAP